MAIQNRAYPKAKKESCNMNEFIVLFRFFVNVTEFAQLINKAAKKRKKKLALSQ